MSLLCLQKHNSTTINHHNFSPVVVDPVKHLLALLFKQSQLETLVQLGLLDLPQLEQLALSRMDLVKQMNDPGDARLHVRVARRWNSKFERECLPFPRLSPTL